MLNQIKGLHHVTSMAKDARENNAFFTKTLGLRRIKKTVNFDAPDVYHLYYGDGAGEVGTTAFSVPKDSLAFWERRFGEQRVAGVRRDNHFGEKRLAFDGPDGDGFALVEDLDDSRSPWIEGGVPADDAIRGFHSVRSGSGTAGRRRSF